MTTRLVMDENNNVSQIVCVEQSTDHAPVVILTNDEDSYYCQTFKTREELDVFIAELVAAADSAWPK